MGPHFPAKSVEFIELYSLFGPPGILQRIRSDLPETGPAEQNRPYVPRAGGQDDGSLPKLPQINILIY